MKLYLYILGILSTIAPVVCLGQDHSNKVIGYRYWFNEIPSDAKSIVLSNPAIVEDLDLEIDATLLKEGISTLHLQFQDSRGQWSSVISRPFNNIVKPLLAFEVSTERACVGKPVSIHNSSKYSEDFIWKFINRATGEVSLESKSEFPETEQLAAGTYDIKLIGSRIQEGRVDSLFKESALTILSIKKAEISVPSEGIVCGNKSILLQVYEPEIGESYRWFKDGIPLDYSEEKILTVQKNGNYYYEILDVNGCQNVSNSVDIAFLSADLISGGEKYILCANEQKVIGLEISSLPEGTTVKWYKDDIILENMTGLKITANDPGRYSAELYSSATGCKLTSSKSVTLEILSAAFSDAGQEVTICMDKDHCMKAEKISDDVTYQWKLNDTDIPGANNPIYCAKLTGKYTLIASSKNGCSEQFNKSLSLYSNPVITKSRDSLILNGEYSKIQWLVNNVKIANANQNVLVCHFDGVFTVEVEDLCGEKGISNELKYTFTTNNSGQISPSNRQAIALYPNPTTGIFTFTADPNLKNKIGDLVNIRIINSLGMIVWQEKATLSESIFDSGYNISKLPNGVYQVELILETTGETFSTKLLKASE